MIKTKNYTFKNGVLTFNSGLSTISANLYPDSIKNDIKKIVIPEGVVSIVKSAFKGCRYLETVILPESLEEICYNAFMDCYKLNSVNLPSKLKILGTGVFNGCSSLENIELPDSLESVGSLVLYDTGYFKNKKNWSGDVLYNGKHLLFVEDGIDYHCDIEEGTKTIADYAFSTCSDLPGVTIPDSVEYIGEYAFSECSSLMDVFLPNKLSKINEGTFSQCELLREIVIPSSVNAIEEFAFTECRNIEEVYIFDLSKWCKIDFCDENSVPFIAGSRLYLNDKFVDVLKIPDDVSVINGYAFAFCNTINSVHIPSSVTDIGPSAFMNGEIENVYISDLSAWCKINFDNEYSTPLTCNTNLYLNNKLLTDLKIPEDIDILSSFAFSSCKSLENVTIGSNIQGVCAAAFFGCSNLKNVKIDNGLKEIPYRAFSYSKNLKKISLPMSIKRIDNKAFEACRDVLFKCGKNEYVAKWAQEHGYNLSVSEIDSFLDSVSENPPMK